MGKVLHPSASTTPSTRKKIQNSKDSLKKLAKRYGIAVNTCLVAGEGDEESDGVSARAVKR